MSPKDKVVALVACTSKKRPYPCPAAELYMASPWFAGAFRLARRLAGSVWILSAKHHLLDPARETHPYRKTLKEMPEEGRQAWAREVWASLQGQEAYRGADTVLWFAGRDYRDLLLEKTRADGKVNLIPLAGLRYGEQVEWLHQHAGMSWEQLLNWCRKGRWRRM